MTFTEALEVMLRGGKVRRPNWLPTDYAIYFDALHSSKASLVGSLLSKDSPSDTTSWAQLDRADVTATDWVEVTA